MKLPALAMPVMPIIIQNALSRVYAESRFNAAHHVSIIASIVLNIQTNMKGLAGPIQLTSEKLKIRIKTPTISIDFIFDKTNKFTL